MDKASGLPLDSPTPVGSDWNEFQSSSRIALTDLERIKPNIENIKKTLNDWPALNYYREANLELLKQPLDPGRVILLGDSIFERWRKHHSFINRGISGQTTPQILLLRLRADVINLKPKAMLLMAGINDIGCNTGPISFEDTTDNIRSIVELATLHKIRVILCSLLPVSDCHYDGKDVRGSQLVKRPLEKIITLNTWLKNYAEERGLIYLDYFSAFVDDKGSLKKELSNDDLHPNGAGYAVMEEVTLGRLQKV